MQTLPFTPVPQVENSQRPSNSQRVSSFFNRLRHHLRNKKDSIKIQNTSKPAQDLNTVKSSCETTVQVSNSFLAPLAVWIPLLQYFFLVQRNQCALVPPHLVLKQDYFHVQDKGLPTTGYSSWIDNKSYPALHFIFCQTIW